MPPAFHIHGAIRVEYRVRTRVLCQHIGTIESEQQLAGGTGALCALALARLGARVRLSGNALGDDSHGRFLKSQLDAAGIAIDLESKSEVVTPYAILLRGEKGQTQTLLSPQARALVLPPLLIHKDARAFDFSFSTKSLEPEGDQGYDALLDALRDVLRAWLEVAQPAQIPGEHEAQLMRWIEEYDRGFGAFSL